MHITPCFAIPVRLVSYVRNFPQSHAFSSFTAPWCGSSRSLQRPRSPRFSNPPWRHCCLRCCPHNSADYWRFHRSWNHTGITHLTSSKLKRSRIAVAESESAEPVTTVSGVSAAATKAVLTAVEESSAAVGAARLPARDCEWVGAFLGVWVARHLGVSALLLLPFCFVVLRLYCCLCQLSYLYTYYKLDLNSNFCTHYFHFMEWCCIRCEIESTRRIHQRQQHTQYL